MAEIEVRDIRHVYGSGQDQTVAIEHVSMTLEDGTASALLGPSGCGKTTLLEIISGLLTPTEGSVLIDGEDVTDRSPAERDIAQIFQFPVVYDSMNVYGNLAFPLRNEGIVEEEVDRRVRRVADLLGLTDYLEQNPATFGPELSQLVALGRGIVREDTSALLFDEPMTDVEPSRKFAIRRRVKEAQEEFGITSLYVTHDQHEALTFADRVAIMKAGRIIQFDRGGKLYSRPVNTFIGHFIGSPGMNLFSCSLVENGAVKAGIGGHEIPLSPDLSERLDPNWTDVQIGIRPSSVRVRIDDPAGESGWLGATVNQVEMLGGFQVVTATLGDSEVEVKARTAHDDPIEQGDEVWLKFPVEEVRVFHEEQAVEVPEQ